MIDKNRETRESLLVPRTLTRPLASAFTAQSADLAVTVHRPHGMISRCDLPTRVPVARPRAELLVLLARSDATKDVEILVLRPPVRFSRAIGSTSARICCGTGERPGWRRG
jgi:hypothetical protein